MSPKKRRDTRRPRTERGRRGRPRRSQTPAGKLAAEHVLRALPGRGPGLPPAALLRALDLGRESSRALRRVLQGLVRDGGVERVRGLYRRRRADGLIEGTYSESSRAGGVVTEDGGSAWRVAATPRARSGDRVVVQPVDPKGGRGDVLGVVSGGRDTWVGILHRRGGRAFVTPYRDDGEWMVRITGDDTGAARAGEVVVVEPAKRAGRRASRRRRGGGRDETAASAPTGKVVERLGPPGTPDADFRAVVWRRRLPVEFPAEVVAAAQKIPEALDRRELARRVDLRERPFVTIDPVRARDHDDAVCVERTRRGGFRLWVAIADVAHYVAPDSPIDREALARGNSVYFPDRAIPMLPERLSSDLCSLRPERDRLAMAVELELDARGRVVRRSFYPAVIRSRAKLSYEVAAAAMEGGSGAGVPSELVPGLRDLAALARELTGLRLAAGSIDFDLPSAEITTDAVGRPVDIAEAQRTVAHRAIEECMLVANRAVAEALRAAERPAIFRNHEPPATPDLEALSDFLGSFGLLEAAAPARPRRRAQGRGRAGPLSPREIARAIDRAAGRPEERLVNHVALRSMRQARYEAVNRGHFALAFESYTHFTSPIRRYADLVVHRALKASLGEPVATLTRDRARLIAGRISWLERVAVEAEREMHSLVQCAFMAPRTGERFDGTVTGVARHGLYVTLHDVFVEGLVHVSRLPGYFDFDEARHELVARRGRQRFHLGDRLRVRLEEVDQVKARIDFSLEPNGAEPE